MGQRLKWIGLLSFACLSSSSYAVAEPSCLVNNIYPAYPDALIVSSIEYLAGDDRKGRVIETCESAEARAWIEYQLELLGVTPAGNQGYIQTFESPLLEVEPESQFDPDPDGVRTGHNIIGIYYPQGTEGLPPKILLSAHYDGINEILGNCSILEDSAAKGYSSVCNAAVDNATGVGAILEVVASIKSKLKAPIAVAFWDGEEDENSAEGFIPGLNRLLGSGYFAQSPTFDTSALQLHVNLESIGYDLFPGKENHIYIVGAHSGGELLRRDTNQALNNIKLLWEHAHFGIAQTRTDLQGFVQGDWQVPYLLFTNGPGSTYHTNADQYRPDLGNSNPVNVGKVQKVANALKTLSLMVANGSRGYVYNPIGKYILGKYTLLDVSFETHAQMASFAKEALLGYKFLKPASDSDPNWVCDSQLGEKDALVCSDMFSLWQELEVQANSQLRRFFWPMNLLGKWELAQKVDLLFKATRTYKQNHL